MSNETAGTPNQQPASGGNANPTTAPASSANAGTASGGNANAPAETANAQTGGDKSTDSNQSELFRKAYNQGVEAEKKRMAEQAAELERQGKLDAEALRKELAETKDKLSKYLEGEKNRVKTRIDSLPENLRAPATKLFDAGNIELASELAEALAKSIPTQTVGQPQATPSPHGAVKPTPPGIDVEALKRARANGDAKALKEMADKHGYEALARIKT